MWTRPLCHAAVWAIATCGVTYSGTQLPTHTIRGLLEASRMPDLLILAPRGAGGAQDLTRTTISVKVDPEGQFQADLAAGSYIVAYYPPCARVTDIRLTEGAPSIELALAWLPSNWLTRAGAVADIHLTDVPSAASNPNGFSFGPVAAATSAMSPNNVAAPDYIAMSANISSLPGGMTSESTGWRMSSSWPGFELYGWEPAVSSPRFDFSLQASMQFSGTSLTGGFSGRGGTGMTGSFSTGSLSNLAFSGFSEPYSLLSQSMFRYSNSSVDLNLLTSTRYSSSLTFSSTSFTSIWNWKWTVQKYCIPGPYGKMCGGILLDGRIPCD